MAHYDAESNTFTTTVEMDAPETASPSPTAPPARGGESLISAWADAGPSSSSWAESEKASLWTNPVLSNIYSLAGLSPAPRTHSTEAHSRL